MDEAQTVMSNLQVPEKIQARVMSYYEYVGKIETLGNV